MMYQCFDQERGKEIAQALLDISAIKLRPEAPFTWASGWKSPIYCDNRVSLSFPKVRNAIKNYLGEVVKTYYPEAEAIAGVATAGIPQGALIADLLDLPFIYVRSKSKSHGMSNQIEGHAAKGTKVVVVEDLVSTGGSSLAAVKALQDAEMMVLGMTCIFTYGFAVAENNFKEAGIDLIYLSEYSLLIKQAVSAGSVQPTMLDLLNGWRKDPSNWG